MNKKTKNIIVSSISILAYIAFVIILWQFISSFLVDKVAVRAFVSGYGFFAPIVFIFVQILQNIVAPIAHYPILLAGGFIFGSVKGFFLNWIGTLLGTILIIILTKKFGRPLVYKMVGRKFIRKYDYLVNKLSPFWLFIIYFLPGFPDDEITYLIGLSNMSSKDIFVAIILGKMGGATLSIIGNDPIGGIVPLFVANALILLLGIIYYLRKNILTLCRYNKSLL